MPDFPENLFRDRHAQAVLQFLKSLKERGFRVARIGSAANVMGAVPTADKLTSTRITTIASIMGVIPIADTLTSTRAPANAGITTALPSDSGGSVSGKAQGDSRAGGVAQQLGSRSRNGGSRGGQYGVVLAFNVRIDDPPRRFRPRHPRYREDWENTGRVFGVRAGKHDAARRASAVGFEDSGEGVREL